jgi:mRNA-degrading endonuclease RelE of RelBE toxin-antitoxin system
VVTSHRAACHFATYANLGSCARIILRRLHQYQPQLVQHPPMAYKITAMEFIETATFTKMVNTLLTDEEYRGLQNELVEDPQRGDLIKGGGGIRKLRHAVQGRGKSGGVRVIYYWVKDKH